MNNDLKKHRKTSPSIDGISSGSGLKFNPQNSVKKPQSRELSSGRQIGDFKSRSGFKPAQNQGQTEKQELPVERRPKYESRRRIFGKKSKKLNKLDGIDPYEAKKAKRKKRLKIAGIVILIFLVIFGFLAAKGIINLRKIFGGGGGAAALQENVDPSKLRGEGDGRVNILLLGRGGEGHDGADLTDTIILMSIDPIAKEAALLSVPRDLYVTIPSVGSMKINSVFYTGKSASLSKASAINNDTKKQAENAGLSLLEKTIQDTLGVPIHYHVMADFSGFKQAIDTVEGIDVDVPKELAVQEDMLIDGQPYKLRVKAGNHHMYGVEALAFSRSRYTSARGDFDRSERQRLVISATKSKILSLGTFSNPLKVASILDNFGNHIQTNFSIQDLMRLYELSKEIDNSKINSIGLADPPNDYLVTDNIGGLSVVVPKAGMGNYKDIQYYVRNTLKDGFLKQENASVLILNGTSRAGLASDKSYELKSYGYNVLDTANAPTLNYSKTVLIDMRNGDKKYTKRYLEQRFGTNAVSSLPDQSIDSKQADFVIILGNDLSSN